MSEADALAFLRAHCRGVLGTIGRDGLPHLVTLFYGVDPAGRLLVTSFAKAQKVRNAERDPRASFLVEVGHAYHEIKAVQALCRVEVLRSPDEVSENLPLIRTDRPMLTNETMRDQVDASLAKRCILRLTPYRLISWDHTRLGENY